jgi:predicted acyl esterase
VLRNVAPDGSEVTYPGPLPEGSRIAAAYGWLRASHRALDPARSTPYRPFHTHDEIRKVTPGEPVALDIEIWPTSVVLPRGHRLVLEVGSHDDPRSTFQHSDPRDRVQAGRVTIHTGGGFDSHLLLPVIPPR